MKPVKSTPKVQDSLTVVLTPVQKHDNFEEKKDESKNTNK